LLDIENTRSLLVKELTLKRPANDKKNHQDRRSGSEVTVNNIVSVCLLATLRFSLEFLSKKVNCLLNQYEILSSFSVEKIISRKKVHYGTGYRRMLTSIDPLLLDICAIALILVVIVLIVS
jgi:hypothetical protein